MSGPFRYEHDSARSPLDRSQAPPVGQSLNFKTNVNRMKTKKWVQAKKTDYGGDDWGDYDEFDEHGGNDEPEPEQPQSSAQLPSQRYYGQQGNQQARNFTDPPQQLAVSKGRRNSFERGEEQRAFSSSLAQPQQDYARQPDSLPALQTRMSPTLPGSSSSPSNTQFPLRKSSVGHAEAQNPLSPRSRTGSQSDKPLPFIRPADIYKRVEEERERERASLDSARPSLDSLSPRLKDFPTSPQAETGRTLQPLETLPERKSEYLPDFNPAALQKDKQPAQAAPSQSSPQITQPEVASVFNDEFWSSGPHLYSPVDKPPLQSPNERGLRSVVDQAFTRKDEQNSVPPTPVTNMNSDMSRSNTNSTAGISPIMSRVPSSATSALKTRNPAGVDASTPAIAEDPRESAPSVPSSATATIPGPLHQIARKPSPVHSRNVSSTSLPLGGTATPNQRDSPARSPAMTPQKELPGPKVAQLDEDTQGMEGGLKGPSAAYATREADIADAVKSNPVSTAPVLGAAEKLSQDRFLESHNAQSPVEAVVPRNRSQSPSKGRVQALAGKFDDVSRSRRGSAHSIQSWERSHDNSRAASPTKGSPSKPSSPVKEFRPHLPGQWESYATTVPTPMEQSERIKGLGNEKSSTPLSSEEVDLTPTTAKRPVSATKSAEPSDPMAALKNAGAALVDSFRSTSGPDETESEPPQGHKGFKTHGDVYMPRPLQLDRTISNLSSIPPTPPAKDTPKSEYPPVLPEKDVKEEKREPLGIQERSPLSATGTDMSREEHESDRLRHEIVASLGPVKAPVVPADGSNHASRQPAGLEENRASSILDSYWEDGDRVSARPSQDVERNVPGPSSVTPATPTTQVKADAPPSLLNRFSWEQSAMGTQVPSIATTSLSKDLPADKIPSPIAENKVEEERQERIEHDVLDTSGVEPGSTHAAPQRLSGLHVVNTKIDPEAVEISALWSTLEPAPVRVSQEEPISLTHSKESEQLPPVPVSPTQVSKPSAHQEALTKRASLDKPLGAREIATITSTPERIATYNKTREHWAVADHGLDNWLASTLEANPELSTQSFNVQHPYSGTGRHKHNASVSRLGKLGGSGETANAANTQGSTNATSPTATAPSGSGFGGRITGPQTKGKDLLHTAGVLGGKGVTSAKGLFAKGKSRFGRDKDPFHSRTDSAPSSREGSEDPGFIKPLSRASTVRTTTTRSEKSLSRSATINEGSEEKRRRRFSLSSSFHRVTHSRSRPTSMILPSGTMSAFDTTPKGTPSRELRRVLGEDVRPHSFHAPDSWNYTPGMLPPLSIFDATPPRNAHLSQERLGILPSPAKSAFSTQEKDLESGAPPVPPIPNHIAESQNRRSKGEASHKILQSVIRHSTPPVPSRESKNLEESPLPPVAGAVDVEQPRASAAGKEEGAEQHQSDKHHNAHQLPLSRSIPTEVHENDDSLMPRSQHDSVVVANMSPAPITKAKAKAKDGSDDDALKTGWYDEDDEDDQPPILNHDPVFVAAGAKSQMHDSLGNDNQDQILQQKPMSVKVKSWSPLASPTLGHVESRSSIPKMRLSPSGRTSPGQEGSIFAASLSSMQLDVSEDEDEDKDKDPRPIQARSMLQAPLGKPILDVSPLLPPLRMSLYGISAAEEDEPPMPGQDEPRNRQNSIKEEDEEKDTVSNVEMPKRPAYETELIGGDVSPISPKSQDDEATPTAVKPGPRDAGPTGAGKDQDSREIGAEPSEDAPTRRRDSMPEATREGSLRPGHESPRQQQQLLKADTPSNTHSLTHRVSATPLHVVHAVQEYAASNSSLSSWDRDSNAANSFSESSQVMMDMHDESDLNTPVAHPQRMTRQPSHLDKAEASHNGYFHGHTQLADSMHQSHQLHASHADMTVPERSRSLLSQISAMVSDGGNPISPAPSTAGRSTPSTIRRMHYETSTKHPVNPGQIPEESSASRSQRTPTPADDEFDLYADHNGAVKGVRDATNQPLRHANTQMPNSGHHSQPSKTSISDIDPRDDTDDEGRRRYSEERPMSFISGPPDHEGKPQDQINAEAQKNNPMPAVPEQYRNQTAQHVQPAGTVIASPQSTTLNQPRGLVQSPPQAQSAVQSPQGFVGQDNRVQATKPAEYNSVEISAQRTSPAPYGPNIPPISGERAIPNAQAPPNGQMQYGSPQDPRLNQMLPANSVPRGPPTPGSMLMPDHDPRAQGLPLGPAQAARNQYEFHQQMMHLQSKYPGYRGTENQVSPAPAQQQRFQQPPPSAKQSAKTRLSSVFKLGSKSQANVQQPTRLPVLKNPNLQPAIGPDRTGSMHSGVSGLSQPHDQSAGAPVERPSTQLNRPPSFGGESQLSQSSTRVQPTDSRPDLLKPTSPAPYNGIPPQRPQATSAGPSGQPQPSQQPTFTPGGQPQPPRPAGFGPGGQSQSPHPAGFGQSGQPFPPQAGTPGNPDMGKKKRLSSLGGLFNRAQSTIPSKLKMSKEDRQASKVQRQGTAPPSQTTMPQWPAQQQQFRPQQPGMAYLQGQMSPQSAPGMRSMGPQFASPVNMSPGSPPGHQGAPGMPQQYQQLVQQGFFPPQQHQQPIAGAQGYGPGSQGPANQQQYQQQVMQQQQAMQQQALQQRAMQEHLAQQRRQQSISQQGVYNAQHPGQQPLQAQQQPIAQQGAGMAQQRQQSVSQQSAYTSSQNERMQSPQQQQPPPQQLSQEQSAYEASQLGRQQPQLQRTQLAQRTAYDPRGRQFSQDGQNSPEVERMRIQQQPVQQQGQQSQGQQQRQQLQGPQLPGQQQQAQQHQVQQQPQQQHQGQQYQAQQQPPQQQQRAQSQPVSMQSLPNQQNVSGLPPNHHPNGQVVVPQRDISVPMTEPQYEAPPIPAAYSHVSGAFISPRDRQLQQQQLQQQQPPQARFLPSNNSAVQPPSNQSNQQYSEPRMPSVSPQLPTPYMPPTDRTYPDPNTGSVNPVASNPRVSPMTTATPEQPGHKQRMSSISETQLERPWHMDFPEGATEQEIVRARQKQFIGAQFTAQQQLQTGKLAQSAPREPPYTKTPTPESEPRSQQPVQGGGFKELLPRNSLQMYSPSQVVNSVEQEPPKASDDQNLEQLTSIETKGTAPPADLPLPMSPQSADIRSPVNPLADALPPPPPPKVPHVLGHPDLPSSVSPPQEEHHAVPGREQDNAMSSSEHPYSPTPPPGVEGRHEQGVTTQSSSNDDTDSHDDDIDLNRSERPRPPPLLTGTEGHPGARERQSSIGILQHPQPASMAASPQRLTTVDMGAEALRRQLLQQEEVARMERIQRAQMQREETDRERRERELARARARELERSASGGGRVGSLRSVTGSRNGGTPGWERRGSTSRPVFELPAVEDDEPDMKATSYPGQEWVPPMWTDD